MISYEQYTSRMNNANMSDVNSLPVVDGMVIVCIEAVPRPHSLKAFSSNVCTEPGTVYKIKAT